MRKFIISDIHGFGNVYYSIISYLDNISKNEEIELFINGDLIDRGCESAEILLDIKKRIDDNKYNIIYLGGNHEFLMYDYFKNHSFDETDKYSLWYENGGDITHLSLCDQLNTEDKILEIVDFVSNLKIYHKFPEKINKQNIVLVHAACSFNVKNDCKLTIKKDSNEVLCAIFTREFDLFNPYVCRHVGSNKYFTIIGHTPVIYPTGYYHNPKENYLNIDGGCACYVGGDFEFNHFPLVEVCDNYLKILTFNSNNEIICGNYFDGVKSISYNDNELEEARKYLYGNVKIKKLH